MNDYETIDLNPPQDAIATQIADLYKQSDMQRAALVQRARALIDAELPTLEAAVEQATEDGKKLPQNAQPYHP